MADLDTLTGSRAWVATPEDYNTLNLVTFRKDGSGQLVIGYGQIILAVLMYRFQLTESGRLILTYVDAPPDQQTFDKGEWGRDLLAALRKAPRELAPVLTPGKFRGAMNLGGDKGPFTYHFRWVLSLDRPPYPEDTVAPIGHLPAIGPFAYYGHPADD